MSRQSRPGPRLIDKSYFTDQCPPSGGSVDLLLGTAGGQYQEAKAGWFVGQDLGLPTAVEYNGLQKLFRLVGRGHAEPAVQDPRRVALGHLDALLRRVRVQPERLLRACITHSALII